MKVKPEYCSCEGELEGSLRSDSERDDNNRMVALDCVTGSQKIGIMAPKDEEKSEKNDSLSRSPENNETLPTVKENIEQPKNVAKVTTSDVNDLEKKLCNLDLGKSDVKDLSEKVKELAVTETKVKSENNKIARTVERKGKRELTDRGPGTATAYAGHKTGLQFTPAGYFPNVQQVNSHFNSIVALQGQHDNPVSCFQIEDMAYGSGHFDAGPRHPQENYSGTANNLRVNYYENVPPEPEPQVWRYEASQVSGKRRAGDDFFNQSKGFRVNYSSGSMPVESSDLSTQASKASMMSLSGGSVLLQHSPQRLAMSANVPAVSSAAAAAAAVPPSVPDLSSDSSNHSEPYFDDEELLAALSPKSEERAAMQIGYMENQIPPNNLNSISPPTSSFSDTSMNISADLQMPGQTDYHNRHESTDYQPSCMYARSQRSQIDTTNIPTTVVQSDCMSPVHSVNHGIMNSSPYVASSPPGGQQASSPSPAYHPVQSPGGCSSSNNSPYNNVTPSPGAYSQQGSPNPSHSLMSPPSIPAPTNSNGYSPKPVPSPYSSVAGSPYSVGSPNGSQQSYPPVPSPNYQMSPATSNRHSSTSSTPPPELETFSPASSNTWEDVEELIQKDEKKMQERKSQMLSPPRPAAPNHMPSSPKTGVTVPPNGKRAIPPSGGQGLVARPSGQGFMAPSTSHDVRPPSSQTLPLVIPSISTNGTIPVAQPVNSTVAPQNMTILVIAPAVPAGKLQNKPLRPILPKPDPGTGDKAKQEVQEKGNMLSRVPAGKGSSGGRGAGNQGKVSCSSNRVNAPRFILPVSRPAAMQPREWAEEELNRARRYVNEMTIEQMSQCDDEGDGMLNAVILKKKPVILKALLERFKRQNLTESFINHQNHLSQTAVYLAARTNEPVMLHMLLEQGADPNIQARVTSSGGNPSMRGAIHFLASSGDQCLETLEVLLHCPRREIDAMSIEGWTALHYAASTHGQFNQETKTKIDSTKVIMRLIEFGENLNKKDGKSGKTPLHYIIETKDLDLIRTVFSMVPADELRKMLNTQTFDGNTSLHIAAGLQFSNIEDHKKLIRMLKQGGANVTVMNGEKKPPKSMVPENKKEIVDILKGQEESRPRKNTQGKNQQNPGSVMMKAAQPIYYTVQTNPTILVPGMSAAAPQM